MRITADVANNSVLVYANEDEYRIIERALNQIDRPKLQVAIDVTIAEVTLNHDLSYGVQFFLTNNNHGSVSFTTGTTLPIITPNLPGFNFIAGGLGTNPHVILNALSQYTDVKILSNPSLVVVDNQPATLEVGQQVPISTGSATVLSANNAVVNTIDYKNTGIILHIQPRVSSNGTVLLDIEQEISAVLNNNVSGATSATSNKSDADYYSAKSEKRIVGRERTDRAARRIDPRNSKYRPQRPSDPRPNSGVGQSLWGE